jgi:hypothetical protein
MPAAASGRVFISYRRQETSGMAGRLYDRLAAHLGEDQVFMDVDTIAPGVDFAEVITQAVRSCEALLAVIGPHWLTATDQDGRRRLDDPHDLVRLEVAAALKRDIRVIPILVEGAVMPRRQELPEDLVRLARRNALSVRHESFGADADRLLSAIEPIVRPASQAPAASGPARPFTPPTQPESMPTMVALRTYLEGLRVIHSTGEAVEETSYYGQLERLLNEVGKLLSPAITCVLTTKNRGAGVPDGGLFIARQAVAEAGEAVLLARAPERGVMEVKGPTQDVVRVARSAQVKRYLERYGKVLVCTYRDFLVIGLDSNGQAQAGERFTLAPDEDSFWALTPKDTEHARGVELVEYLMRALRGDAPLTDPADLAWFLAAYARTGLKRVEGAGDMQALATLRSALEEALGLRFEGEDGNHFFRSALVQTLFYGVFAAWVFWSEQQPEQTTNRFTWRQAQWTLSVPMVRVLFQQLASPANLPVGLDEVLDWTDDVLARVDRKLFFRRFEAAEAVQYFYEPFLQAYDPGSGASSASGTHRRRSCATWSSAWTGRCAHSSVSRSVSPTRRSTSWIRVRVPGST